MDMSNSAVEEKNISGYEKFLHINRAKNNITLNKVLWICAAAGPCIALCCYLGFFDKVKYSSCIFVTCFVGLMALIHFFLTKKFPASRITSYFCLISLDVLVFMMNHLHIAINVSFFIVPLLSLFFCNKKIYYNACFFNYITMLLCLFDISDEVYLLRLDYSSALSWFLTYASSYTIEYIAMTLAGTALSSLILDYMESMYEDKRTIRKRDKSIKEKEIREKQLIEISNTDELTGLYNRRAYEDDIKNLDINEDFVFILMDLNGLKFANDNLGHDAGDEMIIGTADCISRSFSNYGRAYRIGGDEFAVMISVSKDELPVVQYEFEKVKGEWMGHKIESLSISIGYATAREMPGLSILELSKIADKRMYDNKQEYYRTSGIERRKY